MGCRALARAALATLDAIKAPTHLVRAADTRRPTHAVATLLANAKSHWQLHELPTGGHMAPVARPDLFNPLINVPAGGEFGLDVDRLPVRLEQWMTRDGRRLAAFAVDTFSACGAALALLAMIAAVHGEWVTMFVWLSVALFVDGVDGTFARTLKVAEMLPNWSGDALDFVVDFTTYVFVPAYAISTSGLLPDIAAIPLGCAIVVSGALYFADLRMKTADNYFRGFPVLWNAGAFYLFILQPHPWLAAVLVIMLVALTFAPIRFAHPLRVKERRWLNIALLLLWSALGVAALAFNLDPGPWISGGLCAIALYFFTGGLFRHSD